MTDEYENPSPIDLTGDAAVYFKIPQDIFWTNDANDHLLAVFSYCSVKRGLDNTITFSINKIVEWMNRLPNRNKYGINQKIMDCLKFLEYQGYLQIMNPLDHSSINEIKFFPEKVNKECHGKYFMTLYWDEINKILQYPEQKYKKSYIRYETVLLVFVYLKWNTFKRPNKLMIQHMTGNEEKDVLNRQKESPEAFDAYLYQIADDIGISAKSVSAAVKILSELNLLYTEKLPRIKFDDKWRTDHTLFAFTYKREKSKLIATGERYYKSEIQLKKDKMTQYRKKRKAS